MQRNIAIVEDEAAIRDNYADRLRRRGYRVQTYADRKQAQAAFASRLPDLVIIGSHGRTGAVERLLMGSVAYSVVRNTHAPVLVVR